PRPGRGARRQRRRRRAAAPPAGPPARVVARPRARALRRRRRARRRGGRRRGRRPGPRRPPRAPPRRAGPAAAARAAGGRAGARLAAAHRREDAAAAERADLERRLTFELRARFVALLEASERLRLARENLGRYRETVRVSEARAREGDISHAELDKIALEQRG